MTEKMKDFRQLNGLALAYSGDAIYEVYVRDYLIRQGYTKPNELHRRATQYVSAKAQCLLIQKMLTDSLLTEEEILLYKRGRNAKSYTSAKNADITTYRIATGFESLVGYLHLSGQKERLEELISWCIRSVERSMKNDTKF